MAPAPTPAVRGVEQWRPLVAKYFPAHEVDNALRVMHGESRGNPNAIGDTDTPYPSYGLMQIRGLVGRPDKAWLMQPENNIRYSAELFNGQGWRPWSAAKPLGLW